MGRTVYVDYLRAVYREEIGRWLNGRSPGDRRLLRAVEQRLIAEGEKPPRRPVELADE